MEDNCCLLGNPHHTQSKAYDIAIQPFHRVDDGTIRKIGITLQHVLVIEHQFVEDCRTVHMDFPAGNAAVRIQRYLTAVTNDGTI